MDSRSEKRFLARKIGLVMLAISVFVGGTGVLTSRVFSLAEADWGQMVVDDTGIVWKSFAEILEEEDVVEEPEVAIERTDSNQGDSTSELQEDSVTIDASSETDTGDFNEDRQIEEQDEKNVLEKSPRQPGEDDAVEETPRDLQGDDKKEDTIDLEIETKDNPGRGDEKKLEVEVKVRDVALNLDVPGKALGLRKD